MSLSIKYRMLARGELWGRYLLQGKLGFLRDKVHRFVRRPPARNPQETERTTVSLEEFESALRSLGIREGDVLCVHSAWDGMNVLQAKPSEVLALLWRVIGSSGTLVMPTNPMQIRRAGKMVTDMDRSPSMYGLLSESFRRSDGALRSPVPGATVSAVGPLAERFTRDFRAESGNTHYGKGSPWWELANCNAKVLVVGIDAHRPLTLTHCAFDIIGPERLIPEFYKQGKYEVIRNGKEESGMMYWTNKDLLDPHLATIAFSRLIDESGTCKKMLLKGMKVGVFDARRYLDWHLPLAEKYGLPYWGLRLIRSKSA